MDADEDEDDCSSGGGTRGGELSIALRREIGRGGLAGGMVEAIVVGDLLGCWRSMEFMSSVETECGM